MKRLAQKRMVAIVDAYMEINQLTEVDMNDVAHWAAKHGLVPVPRVFDPLELQDAWDERFEQIVLQEKGTDLPDSL